jgi:hypothetical protein
MSSMVSRGVKNLPFRFFLIIWVGVPGLLFARSTVHPPPVAIDPNEKSLLNLFTPVELAVGGDQHYTAADRRYFTNIVANAVGDLDGDGNDDIVLLANAIPQNGAYSTTGVTTYQWSHLYHGQSTLSPPAGVYWSAMGEFLNSGDYLYGAATTVPGINDQWKFNNWFLDPLPPPANQHNDHPRALRGSYAPPSPNVVAGMLDGYVGSDLAWLRGDGTGHFTLHFITPLVGGVPQSVRIRMGTTIRLARLRDPSQTGLDIVLVSATDLNACEYYPYDSTSIEPFTGTGRVFWLENRGWSGTRLDFIDHGIAEYNYDRMPVLFYSSKAENAWWEGPYASLSPLGVEVMDINGDGRLDILVPNAENCGAGWSSGDTLYDGTNPPMAYLDAYYSATFPRPVVGKRWTNCTNLGANGTQRRLFWYENSIAAGPRFSTETYKAALNASNTGFTTDITALTRMDLGGGREAFVSLKPPKIYRRRNRPGELKITETSTQFPGSFTQFNEVSAADFDGDGEDELVVRYFDCSGGCFDKIKVFRVGRNGNDVQIGELFSFVFNNNYGRPGPIQIADINNDGLNDMIFAVKTDGINPGASSKCHCTKRI